MRRIGARWIALGVALACQACGGSETGGGACVGSLSDRNNCGGCGVVCPYQRGCFGGQCSSPAPMPIPRAHHVAALGPDGRIYVIGGYSVFREYLIHLVPQVDAYDPSTNSWTTLSDLPSARVGAVAVASGDWIYLIGGWIKGSGSLEVEMFEPREDRWSKGPPTTVVRADAAAALGADHRVHVFWGGGTNAQDSVEVLEGNAWTVENADSPSAPRWSARAVASADGLIYLIGGSAKPSGLDRWKGSVDVDVFDPTTSSWLPGAPKMNVAHTVGAAALGSDGRIYYAGGSDEHERPLADVEALDVERGKWEFVAPMPDYRGRTAGAAARDGRIYVFGGNSYTSPNEVLDTVLAYDPKEDNWYW